MTAGEPKPKRRSAFRHALGGLMLLVCIGIGMWLLERRGLTDWSGMWRRTQVQMCGPRVLRDQIRPGMSWDEVTTRLGYAEQGGSSFPPNDPKYASASMWEAYPQYGFRVIYRGGNTYFGDHRKVLAVEDLP